jgi:hypothetical protein
VYHTSALLDEPQPIVAPGKVEGFQVAFTIVPAVLTQETEELRDIALPQSSLAGCAKENNGVIIIQIKAIRAWLRNWCFMEGLLWFFNNWMSFKIRLIN